jgi:hypothetical protein
LGDNTGKYQDFGPEPSGHVSQIEPGFTLGGALIKDKLWFFTSLSYQNTKDQVAGFPAGSTTEIDIPSNSLNPYVKLTFQPSQKDKIVGTFNYFKYQNDYDNAVYWRNEDATASRKESTVTAQVNWNHSFKGGFYTNLQVGYFMRKLDWLNNGADATYIWNSLTDIASQSNGWDDINDRPRFQANLDGTFYIDDFLGSHELKAGVQYQKAGWTRYVNVYGDDDGYGLFNGWTMIYSGGVDKEYWADFESKINIQKIGLFVNDTWNIAKNVTLTLGLRFDIDSTIFPKNSGSDKNSAATGDFGYIGVPSDTWNMVVDQTTTAYTWKNLSPRFGLIWDLTRDGKTLFKTNFSRYNASNFSFYAAYLNPVNWVGYRVWIPDGSPTWTWLYWTRVPGTNTEAGYKDHELKAPVSTSFSIGIEREIIEDLTVSARYIQRWDRNLIETADASQLDLDELLDNGNYVWTNWTPHTFTDPVTGEEITAWSQNTYVPSQNHIINPPDAKRDYWGIELKLKKVFSHGWSMNLSYMYNNSKGLMNNYFSTFDSISQFYNNPNAHENAYGRLPMERRHEIKLTGFWQGPLGIKIGGVVEYLTGYPYTRVIYPADLGVPVSGSTTVFAEERGSYNYEDVFNIDLRLEKEFVFKNKFSLSIFLDIFNLLNADTVIDVVETDRPTLVFGEPRGLVLPRFVRFGVRFEF